MSRAIVIYECGSDPYSMIFYAPKGMDVDTALDRADSAVRAYEEAFDFWGDGEHEPQKALIEAGFELADYGVMQEKW